MDIAKKRQILKITLGVLLSCSVISVVGIIVTASNYANSKKEYAKLETYVKVEVPEKKIVEVETIPEEVTEEVVQTPKLINVDFDMDYASLKAINSDFVGWLYYEPVNLSYPVVIDKGDGYYEHHSFELDDNPVGAIFMDYLCKVNFESFNTIIYGHNMRNGTMFGYLNDIIEDKKMIEENPYFYVFTENDAYMYKIVSGYYTNNKSNTYNLSLEYTLDDMKDYVDFMNGASKTYKNQEFFDEEVAEDLKICTLSTCHGLNSNQRTVIHGVLIAKEPRN